MKAVLPLDEELIGAIFDEDLRRIRWAIAYGANPNAVGKHDDDLIERVFDARTHSMRMGMLELMISLGAVPCQVSDASGLLYTASFCKNAEEMECLLSHGVNPNAWIEPPETTYDLIEFDYRYDLWDLRLPIKPSEADKASEEAWIMFLDRCAQATQHDAQDQLRLLRRYGALTSSERNARREIRENSGILQRIVSGGQTGADRAALDWAIMEGITHGGWCPEGRLAEDGRIQDRYAINELPGAGYRQRTRKNVIDSDGTLIVNLGELDGGSLQTKRFAEHLNKPFLIIQAVGNMRKEQAEELNHWLHEHQIVTLNVAGPRESKRPGIYAATMNLLCALLGNQFRSDPTI